MSISNSSTLVLVMLSNDVSSPCYKFDNNKYTHSLPPKYFRDTLLWASKVPEMPELVFLTGVNEPLDLSIASVLSDMAEQVVTPLLPIDKQKALGIPFSKNQTVIASGLNEIVASADDIIGRSVILHIGQNEIKDLYKSLLSIQDSLGSITLRLRDINLLNDHDFKVYEQQLASITDIGLTKQATTATGRFKLLNLNVLSSAKSRIARCPAGTDFIAVGPDGLVYPCPAFYHAGKEYSLGSLHSITNADDTINWNQQECGICDSKQCAGCPFLESSRLVGKENICNVYKAENHAAEQLLPRVAQSGYLFDCLRTLKTRDCATKSQDEGGEGILANQQVYHVTFNDFIQALNDLLTACQDGDKPSEGDSNDSILNRWLELTKIPSTSQKNIFRRRVYETLIEVGKLQKLASANTKTAIDL